MENPEFESYFLNQDGKKKSLSIRVAFDVALTEILKHVSEPSRELALAKTHMEIASMYAQKAMAKQRVNQA